MRREIVVTPKALLWLLASILLLTCLIAHA
jgi:hypothetical protein